MSKITIIDPATCTHDWIRDEAALKKELAQYRNPAYMRYVLSKRFDFVECRVCGKREKRDAMVARLEIEA